MESRHGFDWTNPDDKTMFVHARAFGSSINRSTEVGDGRTARGSETSGPKSNGGAHTTYTTRSKSGAVRLHLPPVVMFKDGNTLTIEQYREWDKTH